jgi:KDO2-lipid IV(A) lauroyltransferase
MTKLPRFSFAFLHPRYWLSWAGIAALWLIMLLPYPLLFRIGHGLGRLAMRLSSPR